MSHPPSSEARAAPGRPAFRALEYPRVYAAAKKGTRGLCRAWGPRLLAHLLDVFCRSLLAGSQQPTTDALGPLIFSPSWCLMLTA